MTAGRAFNRMIFGLALALGQPAIASPDLPPQPPVELLPLEVDANGLGGAGGERLRAELATAQFVALGEDHGFAEPPRLAAALGQELERIGGPPVYHAVEVGPEVTQEVARLLREEGIAGLDRLIDGTPGAMPFLSNLDDAQLALPYARRGRLWGIDQEFIGSTPLIYDMLAARTRDPQLRQQLGQWRDADHAALAAGAFDKLTMTAADPAALAALRTAFAGDAAALRLVEALLESARIYRYNSVERYFESNQERSRLMTGYFLEQYRGRQGKEPRVLFKMGAYHMGRGISPTSIYDIGSMLPGLAAAEGRRSLHIAIVPAAGTVRSVAPSDKGFTRVGPYDEDVVPRLLAAAGIAVDSLPAKGLVLVPLEAIRQRMPGKARNGLPEFARFMLLGFDYLVTTRDATAATHFEAWTPAPPAN